MPYLTVIICTYNRANFLEKCLQSLQNQTVPINDFNVLVVNNNSKDETLKVANSFKEKIGNFKIITENQQGLSYARNTGAKQAQTEWIAYLDDDAKAHSNWVETILLTIDKGDFDVFGGVFTAWHYFREKPKWFSSKFETNMGMQNEYGPLSTAFIGGGNCVFRRSTIFDFKGFPTNLGMKGKKISYAEETLLIKNMRQGGLRIGFVPKMIIDHCVLPYKYSLIWRMKSTFSRGRDSIIVNDISFRYYLLAYHLICSTYSILIRLPIKIFKLLLFDNYYFQHAVFDGILPACSHFGRFIGLLRKFSSDFHD